MPLNRRTVAVLMMTCGVAGLATPAHAADPTKKECVTADENGQDLLHSGKLQEARTALAVCMADRCPRPVREDCAQRLAEIESALPTLLFVMKDGAGNDLVGVRITMDGTPLGVSDGTPIAVDPGEHRFTFEKEGLPPEESTVVVREGEKSRRVPVILEAPPPPAKDLSPPPPPLPPARSDGSTQRAVGIGVGAAGIAGIVLGSVYGILSKSTFDNAYKNECHGVPHGCSAQGATDSQTAYSQATVATISFIAGGALLGTGAVVYFSSPSGNVTVSPTVGSHGGGIGVGGRF